MGKELQALKKIGAQKTKDTSFGDTIETNCSNEYKIIEKALKDYKNLQLKHRPMTEQVFNDFKKLKALEIIKKKKVNFYEIQFSENYEEYAKEFTATYIHFIRTKYMLTKEEYDLLKEVLCSEN